MKINTDKRASAGKREVERSNGMLLLLGFSCWRWCEVISAFGIGGVKLREVQNREKAGDKQGSVFFCSCEKGESRGCGFICNFSGVRDRREFVEGSWLVSLIWDPHVLLPFKYRCFYTNLPILLSFSL